MCNERINGSQDLDESKACGAKINKVHKPWHIVMFLLNFMEPGAGTRFNGCCCLDGGDGSFCGNLFGGFW